MSTTITTPEGVRMYGLLQLRHRLHLEIRTGMTFSSRGPSTMAMVRKLGLTNQRTKWGALCQLNAYIVAVGGPPDQQSLDIQRRLALAGKPHDVPVPLP